MKKNVALSKLIEYLYEYQQSGYVFHKKFISEMKDLISNFTGKELEIFDLLVKQLSYIAQFGRQINDIGKNEKIRHMKTEQEYYSIHLKGKGFNLRILLTFFIDDTPLILGVFNEKSGKSVTDYSKWKPVLLERYKELKEELEDENEKFL